MNQHYSELERLNVIARLAPCKMICICNVKYIISHFVLNHRIDIMLYMLLAEITETLHNKRVHLYHC